MSAHGDDGDEAQDDIVLVILKRVIALGFSPSLAAQIESEARIAYGGRRVRIPKRGKHLTAQEREALFQDGLSNMPTEEILHKHRISRRTLERQMKRGGRFGGG